MSSSNINDPGAIQALLDQLRSSEAWQTAVAANAAANAAAKAAVTTPSGNANAGPADASTRTSATGDASRSAPRASTTSWGAPAQTGSSGPQAHSVASLLSQLQTSSAFAEVAGPIRPPEAHQPAYARPPAGIPDFPGPDDARPSRPSTGSAAPATAPGPTPTPRQDLRACTFQQALPYLARLSEDDGFLKALGSMRAEQADLERQLWKERRDIQRKHEETVNTARTKASIIGAGLTQYEAEAMTDSFRKELQKFDRDRALPAWDGLLAKQQAALEALGVPTMFPTALEKDRERQQEVMQVLDRIVKNEGS